MPILQKHGGTIDKFMGDGIMVTFGAALPTETYAADSLRAVDELMHGVADCNAGRRDRGEPELRVGAAVARAGLSSAPSAMKAASNTRLSEMP